MRAKDFLAFTAVALWASPAIAAEPCPLGAAAPETLHGPLQGRNILVRTTPPSAISFTSGLQRDDDGAPTAYDRGKPDGGPDEGLDHICNGGSVLEVVEGRLVNKYGKEGSVGPLADELHRVERSAMCKSDYVAIRDAHFPRCAMGRLCMLWFGVAAKRRSCGFGRTYEGQTDRRCGRPILQRDAQGRERHFYLTTTWLTRPDATEGSKVQSDYVDASTVPYIVMPGGVILPRGEEVQPGDLAAVVYGHKTVWAVVGDSGPKDSLGEASRALLNRLTGGSDVEEEYPAATILFPGTSSEILTHWPLDPDKIVTAGRAALERAGGRDAFRACRNLAHLDE